MKLGAHCNRTMQHNVGMVQHGDGATPIQCRGVGYPHPIAIGVILSRQAAKTTKIQPRDIPHKQHELRNSVIVAR